MPRMNRQNVDWRSVLVRYIGIVSDNEGTDFLTFTEKQWTAEEWEALKAVVRESGNTPLEDRK